MTILAQKWLNGHAPTPYDAELEATLMLPEGPEGLKGYASRIVYADSLEGIVADLQDNGLDAEMVLTTTKLPNELTWIETLLDDEIALASCLNIRQGLLLKRHSDPAVFADAFFVMSMDTVRFGLPAIVAKGKIPSPFARSPTGIIAIDWIVDGRMRGRFVRNDPELFGNIIFQFISGLFFIQHPKTIHIENSLPVGPKLQQAREKRGVPPLITFKRIHLLVGKKVVRHNSNCKNGFSEEHYGKKRYHRVEGYWRRLHWDDPLRQCVVFIQEHYRGDPTIGVSLAERHVRKEAAL
jgi:hypothetical protein